MHIPRSHRKQKVRELKCAHPGCNEMFFGINSSKYCSKHRDPQTRIGKKPAVKEVTDDNRIIHHDNSEVTTIMMQCDLEGCPEQYEVKIYPRQYIYPKYCPVHRNEYQRKQHLRNSKKESL